MSAQDLDQSTAVPGVESERVSPKATTRPRLNLAIVGAGLIVSCILLVEAAIFAAPTPDWIVVFLAGMVAGLALGTVFGLWIGRSISNDPNPTKFSLATGIVGLNACVGFFGFSYLAGHGIWPKEPNILGWSIGVAATLISASMWCLVNFFWHSRDQKKIHTLRNVLTKTRARIGEAEANASVAQGRIDAANAQTEQYRRRAEEANAQAEEHRRRAEEAVAQAEQYRLRADEAEQQAIEQRLIAAQAEQEADKARTTADGAQRTAQQAQHIAETEKRWRSNRTMLLGRWQCVEYVARPKGAKAETGVEVHKEMEKNKDVLYFGPDDQFSIFHPGIPVGFLDKIRSHLSREPRDESDVQAQKTGTWKLDESGDFVTAILADGTQQTLKIGALTKTTMTVDRSSDEWEVLRFLVKID
jgi:hypothetical protein